MPLNLFGFLMPREADFVGLFCEQSKAICAAAEALQALMADSGGADDRTAAIARLETEADMVAKRIIVAANRTFNAPIDREDILGLARDLDDIVDLIEETAKEIARYRVTRFSGEMRALAQAVVAAVDALREALPLLDGITRHHRAIFAHCERIGQIEGEADRHFDDALTRLHGELRAGTIDVVTYIDLKEIHERLEAVVDKCDDAANAIETITAKHV
jgi:predicted phosphate transport protein (TIGR00153 family)